MKNFSNSLSSSLGVDKLIVNEAISNAGLPENIRPEQIKIEEFILVSNNLKKIIRNVQ